MLRQRKKETHLGYLNKLMIMNIYMLALMILKEKEVLILHLKILMEMS